ncbi:MAG: sugar phosphate nucleotidyltransferase [Candidatus Woykebacteria bacterium]
MAKSEKYAVILAGGGGTRLWPLSRKNKPKQFLRLFNNKTLLQETFDRVKKIFPVSNIYLVTSKDFVAEIRKEIPNLPKQNILIEPESKSTAAAAGLAVRHISRSNPDATVSTFASDHYIPDEKKFAKTLLASIETAASRNYIVTMGIKPDHPDTSRGYILAGNEKLKIGSKGVFEVELFKEKPDLKTAKKYFSGGKYYWNANINSYRASVFFSALEKYFPELLKALSSNKRGDWQKLPADPIDTAVLEKAENILMVVGDFRWYDVGDWETLFDLLNKKGGNVKKGKVIDLDSKKSLIFSEDGLVVTLGVSDLAIINTKDALLILRKKRANEVRRVVNILKSRNLNKFV